METKHKKIVALALASLLVLASVVVSSWGLIIWTGRGWVGMNANREKTVSEIYRGGSASKAGIQVGDSVTAINGISTDDTTRLKGLASSIQLGDTLVYQIKRDKREISFSLPLETPFRAIKITINLIMSLLVGVAFLVNRICFFYPSFFILPLSSPKKDRWLKIALTFSDGFMV
jgi:hypothetical protein